MNCVRGSLPSLSASARDVECEEEEDTLTTCACKRQDVEQSNRRLGKRCGREICPKMLDRPTIVVRSVGAYCYISCKNIAALSYHNRWRKCHLYLV
jgi:hypothetical protein